MISRICSFVVFLFVSLVLAACSGASEGAAPVGEVPATPTSVAAPPAATATPAPEPAPVVGDADLVAAAMAALEAKPDAGEELVAYDVLGTEVTDDGLVTIQICGWTGQSVFESVYEAMFRTTVEADGTVTATHWQTPFGAGECQNSELIESAFATINAYEDYWTDITADPSLFATDPRGRELLTDRQYDVSRQATDMWIEDDIYFGGAGLDGTFPNSVVADLLWRRPQSNLANQIELVTCRDMAPGYGTYRDGVLLTDGRGDDDLGLHSVDAITLNVDAASVNRWRVERLEGLVWSDCFALGDWLEGANAWRPDPPALEPLVWR